ncbi:choice-of-anchor I family protein [Pontibacter sp. G13]|uniref:choice-of-anchor I family protein n=1 Tax=Pontibacter sp. G13 TaxID=3074898 RepID=UPI002889928D|nr:choice-of-anchor I family protein [Pontibacter sp. G13]WNJ19302.1 choice-of-anchor I family protein [Pontibacter sp. G13]
MRTFILVMSMLVLAVGPTTLSAQNQALNYLSTYQAGTFDEGAAEIVAYDAASKQLFYTNSETKTIGILNISDPSMPTHVSDIDVTVYGEGVNSVASFGGIIAAAIEGDDQDTGKVVLFDNTGAFVAEYPAGVLPDMVTFSPDGNLILVANEGEPSDDYTVDPEGSVTIVDISAGATMGVVTQVDFQGFNDQKATLMNAGVRIFGPNATVAQDLEPEYIAVSPDNMYAYVACQENNAMAVINLASATVEDVLPLGYKDHNAGAPSLEEYFINQLPNLPVLGTPVYNGGQPTVMLGGFSGMYFDANESTNDDLVFYAVPDRGPNASPVSKANVTPATSQNLRPFKLPDYQARIVKFTLNVPTGTLSLDSAEQVYLVAPDGRTPIRGFGNAPGVDEVPVTYTDANTMYSDSSYVDNNGVYYHALPYDAFGGDFEGIVRDADGNFWMCDEYRPAIYKFAPDGVMLERFIAGGTKAKVVTEGIFFSEYAEGSSFNKYFEIYNGTTDTVDLEDYMIVSCSNGCATAGEFEFNNSSLFTGQKLAPNEVFVIAHPDAQNDILAKANVTFQFLPNGNDWWAILDATDSTVIDQVGNSTDNAPSDGWDVAGSSEATKDQTLIRKHYILSGNSDWTASAGTNEMDSEWIVEERPTADTVMSTLGSHMDFGTESLPAVYGKRRANRGFEAIALDTDNGILYGFIQSPMDNSSSAARNSDVIRIIGIDPANGTPVSEYVYFLERNKNSAFNVSRVDKIGDAVYAGNGKFYVLERDSSTPDQPEGKKYVFEINLKGATNILGTPLAMADTGSMTLEMMTADEIVNAGITAVAKRKVLNLPSIGYLASDKPEGLALLPDGSLAVLNDNDFGLAGAGVSDNSVLGIISFAANYGLDASDTDDAINIANAPVLGMFQPDAIDAFEWNNQTFLISANEGDARDYDAFSEEDRIKDIMMDSVSFTNYSILQTDNAIGRLNITNTLGDLDGDGYFDELYSYGARSFSIWDAYGNLVFDSGDEFEQIIATEYPDYFNSTNDDNDSFENRSDNKGVEPEAVEIADVDSAIYAFIGLERMGGIMVYSITDPTAPQFVEYELNRDFSVPADSSAAGDLGPEDIKFIPADKAPNGIPLVVVGNEVSGTISLYQFFAPVIISNDDKFEVANTLKAWPNPANGEFINLNQTGDFKVLNMVGQTLMEVTHTDRIEVANLKPGVYIIAGANNQVVRFIKG